MNKVPIDSLVPPSILRDIGFTMSKLRSAGATRFQINIPVEDLYGVLSRVSQKGFMYIPTLLGFPVAAWNKSFVGVFAVPADGKAAVVYDAIGKEYSAVTEV